MVKTLKNKPNVAKKAAENIKKAPQKIMEHTVNKAMQTVEKAAEKQAVRQEKAITKKIQKAVKKAEKQTRKQPSKATVAKRAASKIKTKIKEILTPEKEEVFYYSQKSLVLLVCVYAAIALIVWMIANCLYAKGCLADNYPLFIGLCLTMFLTLAALGSAVFVMIFPPRVAFVTGKSILIDHNAPLLWKDVELAEEKYTSPLAHRKIIVLHLRKDAVYPLTFMQKLCRYNVYTPFSLPIYAIDDEPAERLRHLVKKHCRYKNSCL